MEQSKERGNGYSSLGNLMSQHGLLRKEYRASESPNNLLGDILDFIARGRSTGALLDSEDDRLSAQSILDYWLTISYEYENYDVDASLDEFDPERAPEIPDELCPYIGLSAFQEENSDHFFGRENLVDRAIELLKKTGQKFLIVTGPSGSGKSSLVMAGLIPALRNGALPRSENWKYLDSFVPGESPVSSLSSAKLKVSESAGDESFVVVVDQFEELFTLCTNKNERAVFSQDLVRLSEEGHVVLITLRSDYEPHLAKLTAFESVLKLPRIVASSLSAPDLRKTIEESARLVGLRFEQGVVEKLLDDLVGEPAGLPLLQFTLMKLWENRDRNRITLAAYERLGGGRLALARSADELYNGLTPEKQKTAKRIFLQLVQPSEGLEMLRKRVATADLTHNKEADARKVLDILIEARLLRESQSTEKENAAPYVEVVHEALVRNWPTLSGWLEDSRHDLRSRAKFSADARIWDKQGRPIDNFVYRGDQLVEAEASIRDIENDLNSLESLFLDASRDTRKREVEEENRIKRLQRGALVLVSVLALVVTIAGAIAINKALVAEQYNRFYKSSEAETWIERAELLQEKKDYLGAALMAAKGLGYRQFGRSELPADSSILKRNEVLVEETSGEFIYLKNLVWRNVGNALPIWRSPTRQQHLADVLSIAISPDGKTLASGSEDNTIKLWNLESGELTLALSDHNDDVNSVSFSPDGRTLASGSWDETINLWDVASGELKQTLFGHSDHVNSVSFSPDGRTLASGSWDSTIRIWNVSSGRLKKTFHNVKGPVNMVSFSPDGRTLASGNENDNTVKLWNVASGEQLELVGHDDFVICVAFSSDGKTLASGSRDNSVILWDLASGEQQKLTAHQSYVICVAFSDDGKMLSSGSREGDLILWDLASRKPKRKYFGDSGPVFSVAFSPYGEILASGHSDHSIKLWDVTSEDSMQSLSGHGDRINGVAMSPDGRTVASGSADNTIKLWEVGSGVLKRTLHGHESDVNSLAFSPDGGTLASGSDDATVRLWDLNSGVSSDPLKGHDKSVFCVAFSPDGKTLASGSNDYTIRLWDLVSGKSSMPLSGHGHYVDSVAFSPDGKTLASGSGDLTIKLWDVASGESKQTLYGHSAEIKSVAFSSDGEILVSGSSDKTVRLWDVDSGESSQTLFGHKGPVNSVAFRADGKLLATGSWDNTIKLWEVVSGDLKQSISGHLQSVSSIAFSPDGRFLASGSEDNTVKLRDVASGEPKRSLSGHEAEISIVTTSSDGKIFASGGGDNTIKLWDIVTGQLIRTLVGHNGPINSIAFNSDDTMLVSGSSDETIKLWNVSGGELEDSIPSYQSVVNSVAFSPDDRLIASGGRDKTIKLWYIMTGESKTLIGHSGPVNSVAFNSDGTTLASGSSDTTIKLWKISNGGLEDTLLGHQFAVNSVVFSPDNRTLASGSLDNTILLWNVVSREAGFRLISHRDPINSIAFSPDGKTLASGSEDETIKLWEVFRDGPKVTGEPRQTLFGHQSPVNSVAFTPDGKSIICGKRGETIELWDATIRRFDLINVEKEEFAKIQGSEIKWMDVNNDLYHDSYSAFLNIAPNPSTDFLKSPRAEKEKLEMLFDRTLLVNNWNSAIVIASKFPELDPVRGETLIQDLNGEIERMLAEGQINLASFRLKQMNQCIDRGLLTKAAHKTWEKKIADLHEKIGGVDNGYSHFVPWTGHWNFKMGGEIKRTGSLLIESQDGGLLGSYSLDTKPLGVLNNIELSSDGKTLTALWQDREGLGGKVELRLVRDNKAFQGNYAFDGLSLIRGIQTWSGIKQGD